MKSERSQVQESNLLADKIEQKIAQLRPYLPAAVGVVGVVILLALGYGVYSSQRETRSARAWTDFYFSDTASQDLEAISKDFADTSAGLWARLTAGDANMAKAMEKWNIDRSLADQFFQQATDDYREVAGKTSDPFVLSRARYGLAQALEGLGKRLDALDEYRRISSISGLPPEYLAEVNQRIQWLEGRDGEAFYTWYTEKRTSAPVTAPEGVLPTLPTLPDISFPPTSTSPVAEPQSPEPSSPATETAPTTETAQPDSPPAGTDPPKNQP